MWELRKTLHVVSWKEKAVRAKREKATMAEASSVVKSQTEALGSVTAIL